MPTPDEIQQAAQAYAALGLKVLPIIPVEKRPATRNGVRDASSSKDRITIWFHDGRRDVAIAPDETFWVLDVDPHHGGDASLDRLEQEHGPLPATVAATTGGGGRHLYFRGRNARNLVGMRPGLDVRAAGGYVVAAPSQHKSGGVYAWEPGRAPWETTMANAPPWLQDLAGGERSEEEKFRIEDWFPPEDCEHTFSEDERMDRARRYVSKADPAVAGQGGHTRTFALAATVTRGFDLDEEQSLEVLQEWNEQCCPPWTEKELRHKIRSARDRGREPVGGRLKKPLMKGPSLDRLAENEAAVLDVVRRAVAAGKFISIRTIAEFSGLSRSTVDRTLNELETRSIISIKRGVPGPHSKIANGYTVSEQFSLTTSTASVEASSLQQPCIENGVPECPDTGTRNEKNTIPAQTTVEKVEVADEVLAEMVAEHRRWQATQPLPAPKLVPRSWAGGAGRKGRGWNRDRTGGEGGGSWGRRLTSAEIDAICKRNTDMVIEAFEQQQRSLKAGLALAILRGVGT